MHTRSQRKKVAKWLRAGGKTEPPKRICYPIPAAVGMESGGGRSRGTVSAKGKDGSGRSKWFARVLFDQIVKAAA
jgi:hypothetical protein